MNERGEKLKELETKFADLSAGSSSFLEKARELSEREVGISWKFLWHSKMLKMSLNAMKTKAKKKWWQI